MLLIARYGYVWMVKMDNKQIVNHITHKIKDHFCTFGGGQVTSGNPLSHALKDNPPQFAAGVDVEQVVRFVMEETIDYINN